MLTKFMFMFEELLDNRISRHPDLLIHEESGLPYSIRFRRTAEGYAPLFMIGTPKYFERSSTWGYDLTISHHKDGETVTQAIERIIAENNWNK